MGVVAAGALSAGAVVALLLVLSPAASAQVPGSVAEDRARIAEITGAPREQREAPTLVEWFPPFRYVPYFDRLPLRVVEPDIRIIHNSKLPFSLNDGPLWAGRGLNISTSVGVSSRSTVRGFDVRVAVAPTLVFSQNLPYETPAGSVFGRSKYASPMHTAGQSLDLPVRFGDQLQLRVDLGRSAASVRRGWLEGGVTAENEVWGPGIRNQLVMSAHAPGIPRAYLRTARPLRSRVGAVDLEWLAGTLTESMFFDLDDLNDYRAISGLRVQLRPAFDSNLTVGFARAVYVPIRTMLGAIPRGYEVFTRWETISPPSDTSPQGVLRQGSDQVFSLFARWVFPDAGLEFYAEWARMDPPRTFTELLLGAHHSAGYTVGTQWAREMANRRFLRFQAEATYLEQSLVYRNRPLLDFYVGHHSPHGYTNRGQVIGASIGPGGSSQWIAVDHLWQRAQAGLFVGRFRWENEAMYRLGGIINFSRHDVTMLYGARGGVRTAWADFQAEASYGYRYNYLFQFGGANPGGFRTVDISNINLGFSVSPR